MATNNMWNSTNPASVISGGTGDAALSPTYSVLCSGTTTTNPVQIVVSNGTSGQVLTSNGTGILPSWQTPLSSTGSLVFLQKQTSLSTTSLQFTGVINTTYTNYFMTIYSSYIGALPTDILVMDWSTNNGVSYLNTNYRTAVYYGGSTSTNLNSTTNCILSWQSTNFVDYSGYVFLFDMASTTVNPSYSGSAGTFRAGSGGLRLAPANFFGTNFTLSGVNALRFRLTSGNPMLNITINLYGIKK